MRHFILFACCTLLSILGFSQPKWGNPHPDLTSTWIYSEGSIGTAKIFKRLELGFALTPELQEQVDTFLETGKGVNPFDPQDLDFRVVFSRPDGSTVQRFGFYYQDFDVALQGNYDQPATYKNEYVAKNTPFPWRVRLAPDQIGSWSAEVQVYMRGTLLMKHDLGQFSVLPSEHKGYLEISKTGTPADQFLQYSHSEEPFFAIGINLPNAGELGCFPSQINRWKKGIQEMANYGGNFTRLEVGGQTGLPDWENPNNYQSKLDDLFAFDEVIQTCEKNNVYAVLFRHHVEMLDRENWAQVSWNKNPYNIQLHVSPEGYFSDETALRLQKNSLRYFYSRYCYSPNIAFYGYSEIEAWYSKLEKDDADNKQRDGGNFSAPKANEFLNTWIAQLQEYIHTTLQPRMLFLNTYASQNSVPKQAAGDANNLSDVVGLHIYSATKKGNFETRYEGVDAAREKYKKPVFIEETGLNDNFLLINCCTDIEFHNSIWSSAFMGTFGIGLDYWWMNGIFDKKYHHGFMDLHRFFMREKLANNAMVPQKWSDSRNWKKRRVETYALVATDGTSGLGWVHNAAIFWRNLAQNDSCIKNLVAENSQANPPCICGKDPYGSTKDPYALVRSGTDLYKHENTKGYNYEKIPDAYTEKSQAAIENSGNEKQQTVKLEGFKKSSRGKQKQWYKITLFATRANNTTAELPELTLRVSTSSSGKLTFHFPVLTFAIPDYAYKIEYLGEGTSAENAEIRTP